MFAAKSLSGLGNRRAGAQGNLVFDAVAEVNTDSEDLHLTDEGVTNLV